MNGALEQGMLLLVDGLNDELAEELQELPWNEEGTDNERGFANHATDALLYGYRSCPSYGAERPANEPAPGTPEWSRLEQQRFEDAAARACETPEREWFEDSPTTGSPW